MSEMQVEMNARLEEMNVTNEETKESIRSRYLNLFEEKVQELFNLRSNYEDSVLKLESSERKRLELELELRDLQSQFTSKNEVNSGKILLLEKDLQFVKGQFESLKEACRISVDQLRDRLRDMRTELDIKNHELQQLKSESSSPSLAPSQKNKKYNSSHKSHNGSRS
ncbi:unnamed protein product [Lepeophtheirus salmonis]|uniref:(salmon louse) hypothetical protein n=1 Tax=Lepeophtheirus salmonis TaxID=72036 RepID=A0A7R8D3Z6_LEPSM|nr:unnamed protein product [Lepeophtheirus salmonis]CAF3021628.1 unnamed protein product [Lepeophtheirus salmonis]